MGERLGGTRVRGGRDWDADNGIDVDKDMDGDSDMDGRGKRRGMWQEGKR